MDKDDFRQMQVLEQSLQTVFMQKQQFQSQLVETESALIELKKTTNAYKIVGNILVSAKKEDLQKDLETKKELFSTRVKVLEKQEEQLRTEAAAMQKKLMDAKRQ
ncbi:MAG TPA: prefoldin subunit [Candidatus Nanoarchaeia archaeon]|nr:prefoldin subunit [Candidatus Nanoarchaeia archaeon]